METVTEHDGNRPVRIRYVMTEMTVLTDRRGTSGVSPQGSSQNSPDPTRPMGLALVPYRPPHLLHAEAQEPVPRYRRRLA